MFRRQSNQSPHSDAEINQRRKKEEGDWKLLSLYCIHGSYLNKATNHLVKSPPPCPAPSLRWVDIICLFFFITQFISPSFSLSPFEHWGRQLRGKRRRVNDNHPGSQVLHHHHPHLRPDKFIMPGICFHL